MTTLLLIRLMMPLLLVIAVAGCSASAKAPDPTLNPDRPPVDWMQPAAPLPDIPECDHVYRDRRAWVRCRTEYDRALRSAYVELAGQKAGLVAYINAIVPPTGKGE
jgi:hypothetical protein